MAIASDKANVVVAMSKGRALSTENTPQHDSAAMLNETVPMETAECAPART